MDNLGFVDLILIAILVFFAVRGFFSGFIRELFGLFGFVAGFAFASRYAYEVGQWIKERVFDLGSESLSTLLGFIFVFLLVWLVFLLLSDLIYRLTKTAFPKYLNGLLGVLFGALKAFLMLAIVLHFAFRVEFMSGVMDYFAKNSFLYPTMASLSSKIVKAEIMRNIPKSEEEVRQKFDEAKEAVIEKTEELKERIQNLPAQSK